MLKQPQVAQWPVKLTIKNGAEIDFPGHAIVKSNPQSVRPCDGKGLHFISITYAEVGIIRIVLCNE